MALKLKDYYKYFPCLNNEIEVERVYPSIEDLNDRLEISKLKDSGAKYYFDYLEKNLKIKADDYKVTDLIKLASIFLSISGEAVYFKIKHYKNAKDEVGEVIGEIYFCDNMFGIFIKKEYRNMGYGKKAIKKFYNHVFLYNSEIKNCNFLKIYLKKEDVKLEKFFKEYGFELETEFDNGEKIYIFTKYKYYGIDIYDVCESDYDDFKKYINSFLKCMEKSKFHGKFKKMIKKNKILNYQYVFLKKGNKIIGCGYYKKTDIFIGNFAYVEVHRDYRNSGYGQMFMRLLWKKLPFKSIRLICSYKNWEAIEFIQRLNPDDVYCICGKMIFKFKFIIF